MEYVAEEEVKATCMESGWTALIKCAKCESVLQEQKEIPKADHKEVLDKAVAPTCTESGKTTGKHCETCGEVLEAQTEIPATGHKEVVDDAVEATCTETGKTEGKHCALCGKILVEQQEIEKLSHKEVIDEAVEATCTEPGKTVGSHCDICQIVIKVQEIIPAYDHKEVIIDEGVAATCTLSGKTEGSHCALCGKMLSAQVEIPATGHKETADKEIAATCTIAGKTAGSHCETCGEILKEQIEIPATGHHSAERPAIEPTCTETGKTALRYCDQCGLVFRSRKTIEKKEHTIEVIGGVYPTCKTPGKTAIERCSVCGTVVKESKTIPTTAHAMAPVRKLNFMGLKKQSRCIKCGKIEFEKDRSKSFDKVDLSDLDDLLITTGNTSSGTPNTTPKDEDLQVFTTTTDDGIEALCLMGEQTFKDNFVSLSAKDFLISKLVLASQENPENGNITLEVEGGAKQLGLGMDRDANGEGYLYVTENGQRMTIEAVNFIENGIVFITESGSKLTIQSNRLKNETTTISQEKINEIKAELGCELEIIITEKGFEDNSGNTSENTSESTSEDTSENPSSDDTIIKIIRFIDPEEDVIIKKFEDREPQSYVDCVGQDEKIDKEKHYCPHKQIEEKHLFGPRYLVENDTSYSRGDYYKRCPYCDYEEWVCTVLKFITD